MVHERLRSSLYIAINFKVKDALKQCNIGTQVLFIYLRIKLMSSFSPYFIYYGLYGLWSAKICLRCCYIFIDLFSLSLEIYGMYPFN